MSLPFEWCKAVGSRGRTLMSISCLSSHNHVRFDVEVFSHANHFITGNSEFMKLVINKKSESRKNKEVDWAWGLCENTLWISRDTFTARSRRHYACIINTHLAVLPLQHTLTANPTSCLNTAHDFIRWYSVSFVTNRTAWRYIFKSIPVFPVYDAALRRKFFSTLTAWKKGFWSDDLRCVFRCVTDSYSTQRLQCCKVQTHYELSHLRTKLYLSHLNNQSVPRSKHTPSPL